MENKNWFNNPVMAILSAVLLLMLISYTAFLSMNAFKEGKTIGKAELERDSVTITGEGRVKAIPDVGAVTISVITKADTAEEAQNQNVEQFNQLVADLKESGIAETDLKTASYNVFPLYNYVDGERQDNGFQVTQSLDVTIRDLDNSGDIIAIGSQNGVNEVSGLSFKVDDPEIYREEARQLALENAKQKAEDLSQTLGVKLGKVISFSESAGGDSMPQPVFSDVAMMEMAEEKAVANPSFEAGDEEIVIYATVVYEVK